MLRGAAANQVQHKCPGVHYTMMMAVSAFGGYIPPYVVAPEGHDAAEISTHLPSSTVRTANKGWMTIDLFVDFLQHFTSYINTTTGKVLLIVDAASQHLSLEAVQFAHQHNIILAVIPAHCTYLMQPLDVSFFAPFKRALAHHVHAAVKAHRQAGALPDRLLFPCVDHALTAALSRSTILSGWTSAGYTTGANEPAGLADALSSSAASRLVTALELRVAEDRQRDLGDLGDRATADLSHPAVATVLNLARHACDLDDMGEAVSAPRRAAETRLDGTVLTDRQHRATLIDRQRRREQRQARAARVVVSAAASVVARAKRRCRAASRKRAAEPVPAAIAENSREISPLRKRARRPPARYRDMWCP